MLNLRSAGAIMFKFVLVIGKGVLCILLNTITGRGDNVDGWGTGPKEKRTIFIFFELKHAGAAMVSWSPSIPRKRSLPLPS